MMSSQPEKEKKFMLLKAGHHGSKNSSSDAFLQAVHPDMTVISCGKKNRYGHPHADTLARLETVESKVYRTDESGAVQIEIKRGRMKVRCGK